MSEQDWARDRSQFVADVQRTAVQGQEPSRDQGCRPSPLGRQFAALTHALLDAQTVADVLEQVVRVTKVLFPAADLVSITLRSPDGRFHTPIETDPVASKLDQLQYELEEGPCLDAADHAGPAVAGCRDLRGGPWRRWGPAAADLGVAAVVATTLVPVPTPPRLSGALNLYSRRSRGLDEIDCDQVLLLATHASLALARTDATTRAELRETQLRRAIDSRDVIGQAKGILMERRGYTADEAFDMLRRTSQHLNVKLVELAETVTDSNTAHDGSSDLAPDHRAGG